MGQSSELDRWAHGLTASPCCLRLGNPGWLPQLAAGEIAGRIEWLKPVSRRVVLLPLILS